MDKIDFMKQNKVFYSPKTAPSVIEMPELRFIMTDGFGDPNDAGGEYSRAVELLYGVMYAIKMSPRGGWLIDGYTDFKVPPLEGLWQADGDDPFVLDKSGFRWTSMMRCPDFVTDSVLDRAVRTSVRKKARLEGCEMRLGTYAEGLCIQCLHIGSYDSEPATLEKMRAFAEEKGLVFDLSDERRHHEIYLSDPGRTAPSKMKTVLRYPVRRK